MHHFPVFLLKCTTPGTWDLAHIVRKTATWDPFQYKDLLITYGIYKSLVRSKKIPQCLRSISHNAPFCNRNVHISAKISVAKGGIVGHVSNAFIVGFVRWVYHTGEILPNANKFHYFLDTIEIIQWLYPGHSELTKIPSRQPSGSSCITMTS